jgi:hypothetical protein
MNWVFREIERRDYRDNREQHEIAGTVFWMLGSQAREIFYILRFLCWFFWKKDIFYWFLKLSHPSFSCKYFDKFIHLIKRLFFHRKRVAKVTNNLTPILYVKGGKKSLTKYGKFYLLLLWDRRQKSILRGKHVSQMIVRSRACRWETNKFSIP